LTDDDRGRANSSVGPENLRELSLDDPPTQCDVLTASIADMDWFNDQKAVSGVLLQSGYLTSLSIQLQTT